MSPFASLFEPLTSLRNVGPALAERIGKAAGGERVLDLLFHLPESYIDRRARPAIRDAVPGTVATFEVEVMTVQAPPGGTRQPWRVSVTDGTGFAEIPLWEKRLPAEVAPGRHLVVSGKVDRFGDRVQIGAARMLARERGGEMAGIDPVWPLVAGLFPSQLRGALRQAVALVPEGLAEWHDAALLKREGWPGFREALVLSHLPKEPPGPAVRARLAYDELLAHQVAMSWARRRGRKRPGVPVQGDGKLRAEALRRFGHALTGAQLRAIGEIEADMAAPRRMLRLLQGDVGSGKTAVALQAMLLAAEAGRQAALMAPTEVLARQHFRTLDRLSPAPVGLLTGSVKGVERRRVLGGLESGRVKLAVGTHALFQEAVAYQDLALAVIDEQHRFGVAERMLLGAKGGRTDVLVMTATPIPRSVLLLQYGEMEVSRLDEKPAGRQPIRTSVHSLSTLEGVVEAIGRAIGRGDRVYWVCPLVTESELLDMAAAEARFAALRERFGDTVGLAHGQMEGWMRDRALAEFAAGQTRLLVATTVVEVGVDVPEASVMVIEHAERFGLAQLHQLRGRVGRGAAQSYCLLLHEDAVSESTRRRMALLKETEDGFRIADEDFRLRGGGDLMGKRQSGLPGYRMAEIERDERLLLVARKDAEVLLDREPELGGERGMAVRGLLGLFGRGEAVLTLGSG